MNRVRINDVKTISPVFLTSIVCMMGMPWLLVYLVYFQQHESLWYGILMSGFVGVIALPSVIYPVILVCLALLHWFITTVLVAKKRPFAATQTAKDFDLELFLTSTMHAEILENTELGNDDLTRIVYGLPPVQQVFRYPQGDQAVTWYVYDTVTVIRIPRGGYTLPPLIIDATLNDSTSHYADTSRVNFVAMDMGGDFGDFYRIHTPIESQTSVYEALTPPVMIELMTTLQAEDVVIAGEHFDFVITTPTNASTAYEHYGAAQTVAQLLQSVSKPSYSTLQAAVRVKRAARHVMSFFSSLSQVVILGGGGVILMSFVFAGISNALKSLSVEIPESALTHALALIFVVVVSFTILGVFLAFVVLCHSLVIYALSHLIISTVLYFKRYRNRKRFAHIARKYAVS